MNKRQVKKKSIMNGNVKQLELNPEYTDNLDIEENGFGIDDDFEIE